MIRTLLRLSTALALACALGAPRQLHAASPDTACLVKTSRTASKVAKAQDADVRRCLAERARDRLGAGEADACVLSDARHKVARARARIADVEASRCSAPPAFGFSGADEAGRAAATEALGIAHELFGANVGEAILVAATDSAGSACQLAVHKAAGRLLALEKREFDKCLRAGLKSGGVTDATSLASCLDAIPADSSGKIAKGRSGIAKALATKCPAVDLDALFPGSCAGAGDLGACVEERVDCRTCLLLSQADALDVDCDLFDDGTANLSCILCNGAASLCDRPFDEVVYPTTHNAMSNAAEGWLAPNQAVAVVDQLAAGARSLMLDTWYWDGDAVLCHGGEVVPGIGCNITGMKPLDVGLSELTAYLDAHPHEVLSIIFESYISEADTAADFVASGLIDDVYAHPAGAPWPTLRELIAAGTRMVVFTDDSGATLPWHHYVWAYAWETHFSAQQPSDFSCDKNRGSKSNPLFIFNHFLTNPFASPTLAAQVNYDPFFLDRALQCEAESNDLPNFVTVDFESIGDLYAVVRSLNGLPR